MLTAISSGCACPPPLQMIKGNTFAATAFFSYGAFWMAWFTHQFTVKEAAAAAAAVPGATAAFTGAKTFVVGETLIMVLWGVFTFLFWIPTLRKNGCLCFVFGSLFITFFLLAGGQWSPACGQAAGYIGFLCGCSAIYTAFAEVRRCLLLCCPWMITRAGYACCPDRFSALMPAGVHL